MGRSSRTDHKKPRSQTLPSSPTHSSSSSDFEFTISLSPRKSTTNLIPADELFYKGQLLPLHLSPRLSMVRTLASSSTSSSSDTTTTASRDSSSSSNDSHSSSFSSDLLLLLNPDSCHSSRPSSVPDEDHKPAYPYVNINPHHHQQQQQQQNKKAKYFSLSRFSSVFCKEPKSTSTTNNNPDNNNVSESSVKRMSSTAKDVIRKYLKKVKPLYEKLSQKQQQKLGTNGSRLIPNISAPSGSAKDSDISIRKNNVNGTITHSFSGNLRYPRRRSCVSSCPSSMRSSPSHSGVLSMRNGVTVMSKVGSSSYADSSSMEELQSAIQGAIAHCKNSMIQTNKTTIVSYEI